MISISLSGICGAGMNKKWRMALLLLTCILYTVTFPSDLSWFIQVSQVQNNKLSISCWSIRKNDRLVSCSQINTLPQSSYCLRQVTHSKTVLVFFMCIDASWINALKTFNWMWNRNTRCYVISMFDITFKRTVNYNRHIELTDM